MTRSPLYLLVVAALVAAMYGTFVLTRQRQVPRASRVTDPPSNDTPTVIPSIPLTDQDGQPFELASLRGHIWVASVFFTACPGTCWRQNQALAEVQEATAGSDIRLVSLTCDPATDTPAVLKTYAARFSADPARWSFLTGKLSDIVRLGNEHFGIEVEQQTHSDRAVVFDAAGNKRGNFRMTQPDDIARLKKLLGELSTGGGTNGADSAATSTADRPTVPEASN